MFSEESIQAIARHVLGILTRFNAVIRHGHFVYHSGRHGSVFVEKDVILTNPDACSRIANLMASSIANLCNAIPEVVIGMAEGSISLASHTALLLNNFHNMQNRNVLGLWASRNAEGKFFLRPSMEDLVRGRKVVIVEDVTTTGSSICEIVKLLRNYNCNILGAGIVVNRGGVTAEQVGVPRLISLLQMEEDSYTEEECPLCLRHAPINTKFGHGKEFLARKGEE